MITEEMVKDWEEKEKAVKHKARKFKKENHYTVPEHKCCYNCGHADHGYEGEIDCSLLQGVCGEEAWRAGGEEYIEYLGRCDRWKKRA